MPEPTWEWGAVGSPWTLTTNGTSAPTSVTYEVGSMATTATYNITISMADAVLSPRMIEYERIQQYLASSTPVRPVQLSPEELAVRQQQREEAERQRMERRRRHEREELERREQLRLGTLRATELLVSFLDEAQRAQYASDGTFDVIGSHGGRYRIETGVTGNVTILHNDEVVVRLCAHPETDVYVDERYVGTLPTPDVMLAQMLALQTDEVGFNRTANVYWQEDPHLTATLRAYLAPEALAAAIAS